MRKILWVLVTTVMALSLVLAACAPAAVEQQEEKKITVTEKEEAARKVVVQKDTEKKVETPSDVPKYGGWITASSGEILDYDEVVGTYFRATTLKLTNEELWMGDWAKGPAGGYGTGEAGFVALVDRWDLKAGQVAESWDISVPGTMVWNIRRGVHWALNQASEASRLVGGRELTADDVVFSLKQNITDSRAFVYRTSPALRTSEITAPDKYTVLIKYPPDELPDALLRFGEVIRIVPPEVVARYGDMRRWQVSVGTGPFILTDVLPGSTATLVRNPNYWGKDPVGPGKGNQLPYVDGIRFLVLPDASTRLAAFRTGKLDVGSVPREDRDSFLKQRPEVVYRISYDGGNPRPTYMRTDKAPFNDVRVRRALMMATDFDSIVTNLYGGEARINTFPTVRASEYSDAYLPLEEAPESVQELYRYNPEKAKQLLTEAGFPQGFKTTVLLENSTTVIDYYSILKDMWRKVGIEVTFDIKETAAWSAALRDFPEMAYGTLPTIATIFGLNTISGPSDGNRNHSRVRDERVDNTAIQMSKLVAEGKQKEALLLNRELMKYALDQAWAIPAPVGASYAWWWPWLRNYSGEGSLGYHNQNLWMMYVWIDQALKKSMGY